MTEAPAAQGESAPRPVRKRVACLLLALLVAAIYWPVTRHGFVNFDDPDYVTRNPQVQAGLSAAGLHWAFSSFHSSNWHPLTWISHMVDSQLYGLRPAGHHLTNLWFHLVNTLLLFHVFERLTRAFWRSALLAALFATHPLHVESVAWVAERKDLLSTCFGLLCLWAYGAYAQQCQARRASLVPPERQSINPQGPDHMSRGSRSDSTRKRLLYTLALFCFALSLLSKPMLVTWPFVLLLVDYWPLQRFRLTELHVQIRSLRRLIIEKIPFLVLSVASAYVTLLAQKAGGAVVTLGTTPLGDRVANAVAAYGRYLGKSIWPAKLAVFYPYTRLEWSSWQVLGAGLVLCLGTAAIAFVARRKPWLAVGWFWFLGTLVPVIGLVQVGQQSLADRYTYVPLIGLFLLLVWGSADLLVRLRSSPALGWLAAGSALAGCTVLSAAQVKTWRDTDTLFRHALAVTQGNYVAHTVVATCLAEQGKLNEADEQCRLALQISPRYPEAHQTLGNLYAARGKYDEAIACYRQAIAANPNLADAYQGMGNALLKQGKYAEAETSCRAALTLAPLHAAATFCLAMALHREGKITEAIEYYRRLLVLNPNLPEVHRFLANAFVAQGKLQEATDQLRAELRIQPGDLEANNALGLLLLGEGRLEEARARFDEVVRLQRTNSVANYQLALIHQSRKEIKKALACYRLALAAKPDWPEALNNLAWLLAASREPEVRNGREAVVFAERACKLTQYREALLVGTLAAAYAEAGRFADAVAAAQRARALALATNQPEIAKRNQQLCERYRSGQPYHESE